ncbi:hypothetical protein [Waterburya agarophytonicola]|nr:hypothetical protein [Waterburya agarophytonicola]
MTVLVLNNGFYDENIFESDNAIASPLLTQLQLSANQIFTS